MNASITAYHENVDCTWCEKPAEGITIDFDSGFLQNAPLCFKCLQQALRVHHKQHAGQSDNSSLPAQSSTDA